MSEDMVFQRRFHEERAHLGQWTAGERARNLRQTGHPLEQRLKEQGSREHGCTYRGGGGGRAGRVFPTRPWNLGSVVQTGTSHCTFGTRK